MGTVPVSIVSTETSVHVVVRLRDDDREIVKCRTPCVTDLPFGDYHLDVRKHRNSPSAEQDFRVRGPTFVTIRNGSREARDVWLGIALLSTVIMPVVLVGTVAACWRGDSNSPRDGWCGSTAEGVTLLGLIVLVPVSWIAYRNNDTHVDVDSRRMSLPIAIATKDGGVVGWSFAF
jgi:hypothetical protein